MLPLFPEKGKRCRGHRTPKWMSMWHHSPVHRLGEAGAYMVTAGTHRKERFFDSPERLEMLQSELVALMEQSGWSLQAWAVMPNHYHFVAMAGPGDMTALIRRLHSATAQEVNREDKTPGRRVWFQYWDSHLTYQKSYYARLNYVQNNPVHHGLASDAKQYRWCSAGWFEQNAKPAFYRMVAGFKCDRVNVPDDF